MKEDKILLAYGNGGLLSYQLIRDLFLKNFYNPILSPLGDSAVIDIQGQSLAFTTDSYVVDPIFFPGGDIGSLAVFGTVNDLAVMGAIPEFISCSFIIEEGLEYITLERIVESIKHAAEQANVIVATGDTKVVNKGSAHKIFVNTSGIGPIYKELKTDEIKAGDSILINGAIGDHGLAVLAGRGEFELQTELQSDCAPLNELIKQLLDKCDDIKFMRDPTRGGIASTLNELVIDKPYGVLLYEENLPLRPEVQEICELLGFDPLYIANEGKVVAVIAENEAEKALEIMKSHELGKDSAVIGEITSRYPGKVTLETVVSGHRLVDMLVGDQFPRIC